MTCRSGIRLLDDRLERRVSAAKLYEALCSLAQTDVERSTRECAARALLTQLRLIVRTNYRLGTIRRESCWLGPTSPILEDAIQHTALVASTGGARFHGTSEWEALAWCARVLSNYLRTELRIRQRIQVTSAIMECNIETASATATIEKSVSASQEKSCTLHGLRENIREHLNLTRRPRAASSLFTAVCCYLDHIAGVPLDAQLKRWVNERNNAPSTPSSFGRARNRVYQYHHRGREVLMELEEKLRSAER
ncbi:MAG TPA: hypothetical protein VIV60_13995 [Polyangiaceae bacterium]